MSPNDHLPDALVGVDLQKTYVGRRVVDGVSVSVNVFRLIIFHFTC